MNIEELWERACQKTEIIRLRIHDLPTFDSTTVPYCLLAESTLNQGDTVVRRGSVVVQKPAIVLPNFSPQFEGFDFEDTASISSDNMATFLLMRGIQFPSLKYRHQLSTLEVFEGSLSSAVTHWKDKLERAEDIATGLMIGPEEAWQCSVLLLVGALMVRSSQGDVRKILEAWKKRQRREKGGK